MARGERRRGTPEEEALIAARHDLWRGLNGKRYMPGETVRYVHVLDQERDARPREILLHEEVVFLGPALGRGQESQGWVVVGLPIRVVPVVGLRRRRRGDPRPYGPLVPGGPDVERTIRRVLAEQGMTEVVLGEGEEDGAHDEGG